MNRSVAVAVLALLLAPALAAHEATYLMRGSARPVDATTDGHVQSVTPVADGWVQVRVSVPLTPVGSVGSWAEHRAAAPRAVIPDGFELPASLARRLRPEGSAWEAASEILAWVSTEVALDPEDPADQDAASVLGRRRGRCSGLANAAAALLLTAGFEARTVSGLLIDGEVGVPHRWLECRLPGVGWVATDPTLGLWVLTPRHVVFSEPVLEVPEIRVERSEPFALSELPLVGGLVTRPNVGAELLCRQVDGASPVLAVLQGPAGDVRRAVASPEVRFERLFPGRWRLEVVRNGTVIGRLALELRSGELRSCILPSPGAAQEVES